jgi:hypothetical protein
MEDKRVRMVYRNPELAKKIFPFKRRLGIDEDDSHHDGLP